MDRNAADQSLPQTLRNRPSARTAFAAPPNPARVLNPHPVDPSPAAAAAAAASGPVPAAAPPPAPRRPQALDRPLEPPEVRKARIRRLTVAALREIAKTAALILCLTVYSVLGALAFEALEQQNERETCFGRENLYLKMEHDAAVAFWKVADSYELSEEHEGEQYELIDRMVENFTQNVLDIGYDGTACDLLGKPEGRPYNWNFPGALLFSVTIFTTVGYGNITPKTDWGRMFCIAYAMLGLPLMFFALANIGEHMAIVFRFVYIKLFCLGWCASRRRRRRQTAHHQKQRPPGKNYSHIGNNDDAQEDGDEEEEEEEEEEDEEEEVSIPVTVTLLVIAGYVGLGALLFAVWEGWDPMAAAYFTFVTISTIGLGDLVPGVNVGGGDAQGSLKLLICAAFLLFGMALLSMGFDLIHYEMASKMTAMGGQNVGRAGDTVNELQGREEDEGDGVALPSRNVQASTRAAAVAAAQRHANEVY